MKKIYTYDDFVLLTENLKKYTKNNNSVKISDDYSQFGEYFIFKEFILFKKIDNDKFGSYLSIDRNYTIMEEIIDDDKFFDININDYSEHANVQSLYDYFVEIGLHDYLESKYNEYKNILMLDLDNKVIEYMINNSDMFYINKGSKTCDVKIDLVTYSYDISDSILLNVMFNQLKCSNDFLEAYRDNKNKLKSVSNISIIVDIEKLNKDGFLPTKLLKTEEYIIANGEIFIYDDFIASGKEDEVYGNLIEFIPINNLYGFFIMNKEKGVYTIENDSIVSFGFIERSKLLSNNADLNAFTLLKNDTEYNHIEYDYKKVKTSINTFINHMKKYSYNIYNAKDSNTIAKQVYYSL